MTQTNQQQVLMDRRGALKAAGAGVVALGLASHAHATPDDVANALNELTGGVTPVDSDKLDFNVPAIAENGAVVPVGVSVDSPMTPDNYVKHIHLLADGNPSARVVSFNFTPTGKAEINIRIRLSKTQHVTALAVMSDGSILTKKKEVQVTIGGC